MRVKILGPDLWRGDASGAGYQRATTPVTETSEEILTTIQVPGNTTNRLLGICHLNKQKRMRTLLASSTVLFTILFSLAFGIACGYAAIHMILRAFGHRPSHPAAPASAVVVTTASSR